MSDPAFSYLHVRTPYGPGGGPGLPAAYLRRAREWGYPALGCADMGAWPGWAHEGAVAGVRPIFGLELAVEAGAAAPVPVLLLARDVTGLRHLIGLHNAARAGTVPQADLLAQAAGLTAVCLAYAGAGAGSPLVTGAVRKADLDPWRAAFGADALYFGLPAAQAEQALLAERAAALGLPLLALPTVCYPQAADAPAYAALCAWRGQVGPEGAGRALLPPDQVAELYAGVPAALAAAEAVAASCRATLRELQPPDAAAAEAALAARVWDALAGEGREMSAAVEAELAGLRRLGLSRALLMAAGAAAAARAQGVLLGAPGGVAAAGQVAGLLGLHPADPFGAWPPWLAESARPGAALPQVTVAACRRATVLAEANRQAGPAGGRLLPAGGWHHLTPAEAVRLVRGPFNIEPVVVAELVAGLANFAPAQAFATLRARPAVQAALTANPALDEALRVAAALVGTPVAPLPDQEALVWVEEGTPLPLVSAGPADAPAPFVLWPATMLGAWGWPISVLRGDPALDIVQRASDVASPELDVPPNGPALLLAGGQVAGVPLAPPAATESEPAQGVVVALTNALLPPDGAEASPLERAVLGALVGGAQLHPWAADVLRRRLGQTAAAPPHAVLAPVLAATWGVPLFQEQFSAGAVRLALATEVPGEIRFRLQSWLDEAAAWAVPYAEAEAAGRTLLRALYLKAGAPAAFLAAALTTAAERGDAAARAALLAEAPVLGVGLLPPDVDRSAATFTVERVPGAAPAVRWGLLGVPGWTAAAAAAFVHARAAAPDGQFADLDALCAALDPRFVSRLALDSLLRSGAGDRWGSRGTLLAALDDALARARVAYAAAHAGTAQLDLFATADAPPDLDSAASGEPGEPATPHSALPTAHSPADWRRWEEALLGQAFTAPPDLTGAGGRGGPVLDLRQIGPALRGTSVTLPVMLAAVRVVTAPEGEQMALARVEDAAGMLPLVVFPDVYGRSAAFCTPGSAVILTARVQQAEAGEGGGSAVVLVATRLAPYKVAERGPSLDVTPVERRAPAVRAPRKAPDPTEYSKTGARYYRAPRPDSLPEPPPDLLEPPIEAYEESAEFGMGNGEWAESGARGEFGTRIAEGSRPVAGSNPVVGRVSDPASAPAPPAAPSHNPKSPIPNPQVRIILPPLDDEAADAGRLLALRAILRRFPGDTPVTLVFPGDTAEASAEDLPLKYGVAPTPDLRAAITALLDPACLVIE